MKTHALVAGVCAALVLPSLASAAMTDVECAAVWKKADANGDNALSVTEAQRYLAALRVAQKPIADGILSQAAFLEHCKAGHFATAVIEPGAPLAGANSFTEAQANDRAMAAGLTSVSALKKDDKGVWRGTAADGAKTVNVAVDYRGNVVAN